MARNYFVDRGKAGGSEVYGCYDGYSYFLNKVGTDATETITTFYLRCVAYYSNNCHGTARIEQYNGAGYWVDGNIHCCEPDQTSHQVRRLRAEILQACRSHPYESPRLLVNRIGARYHPDVSSRVRLSGVRFAMRRARAALYPNIPGSVEDLGNLLSNADYPQLTQTVDGEDCFYSGLVGPPGEQSLVFMSRRIRDRLGMVRSVFVDATFGSTPAFPRFSQTYQIVTVLRSSVIPLVVALMERKTHRSYDAILVHIKERAPFFRPLEVMLDFECAAFRAWLEQFQNSNVSGCYIHHIRAVLQNCRDLGLRPLIADDGVINTIVRATLAIPLLPQYLLQRGLQVVRHLATLCDVDNDLRDFFDYYETTWLSGWRFECLSVYNLAHRTNNACESAHRILRLATGPLHPNIWTFIDGLRSYEHNAYTDMVAFESGRSFGASRRTSVILNDEAIKHFTRDLMDGNISIRTFLLKASRTVTNYVDDNI